MYLLIESAPSLRPLAVGRHLIKLFICSGFMLVFLTFPIAEWNSLPNDIVTETNTTKFHKTLSAFINHRKYSCLHCMRVACFVFTVCVTLS